ncbi:MAG: methyltransferase [Prochlorococcus marinus CUG1439]|uniref:methyltransferase n=1 Tax=Prochlorococcus sp. MIT 1314 TaxID=3096220 RepID=UPI001B029819|nr:methyltransferase [Prochlorococcus sp. MIT 1314]MCR8538778.1 methyltransferase [Prochlorococcus marinus CUG1439]
MPYKEIEYIPKCNENIKILLNTNDNVFAPTATSDFLISAVASSISKVDKLLDLGCGNGIVGISLSKLNKANKIYCSDISNDAVKVAKLNIKLNNCEGEAIKSNIFSNWNGYKFDVIVDDISGISEEVAKLSDWFENVPCDAGIDGTSNIEKVLNRSRKFLNKNGKIFFPVISLSNTKKIIEIAENNFKDIKKISHNEWFLPEDLSRNFENLEKLKKEGYIDYCQKFGQLICWTDIYSAK